MNSLGARAAGRALIARHALDALFAGCPSGPTISGRTLKSLGAGWTDFALNALDALWTLSTSRAHLALSSLRAGRADFSLDPLDSLNSLHACGAGRALRTGGPGITLDALDSLNALYTLRSGRPDVALNSLKSLSTGCSGCSGCALCARQALCTRRTSGTDFALDSLNALGAGRPGLASRPRRTWWPGRSSRARRTPTACGLHELQQSSECAKRSWIRSRLRQKLFDRGFAAEPVAAKKAVAGVDQASNLAAVDRLSPCGVRSVDLPLGDIQGNGFGSDPQAQIRARVRRHIERPSARGWCSHCAGGQAACRCHQ